MLPVQNVKKKIVPRADIKLNSNPVGMQAIYLTTWGTGKIIVQNDPVRDASNLFNNMKALKYVNLANNRLSRSVPSSIGILSGLESFNNELNGMTPEEMSQKNIRELND